MRRQFRRDDRRVGMRLAPRMAGDQPDDPFGLGRLAQEAGIDAPLAQPVEPERPSGLTMISTTSGSPAHRRWRPHGAAQHGAAALGRVCRPSLMPPSSIGGFGREGSGIAGHLPPDLSHESLKAVAADRAPASIGFGQRRGGGQLVADEQRQALEHHIDIAASAGNLARHAIEPG
jgi:hypothetical protein